MLVICVPCQELLSKKVNERSQSKACKGNTENLGQCKNQIFPFHYQLEFINLKIQKYFLYVRKFNGFLHKQCHKNISSAIIESNQNRIQRLVDDFLKLGSI